MAQFKPAAIAAAHNRHGVEYVVIITDLADVVRSKEAAGRPNDLAVLPALYRRLAERQAASDDDVNHA